MKISTTKQTEDFIELETPAYFHNANHGTFYKVDENEVISAGEGHCVITKKREVRVGGTDFFADAVTQAMKGKKSSSVDFLDQLFKTQTLINEAAGLSEIPTIFTQNKFKSFQNQEL